MNTRSTVLKETKALSVVFMLVGGLLEFTLPMKYIPDGLYYAVPEQNLILAILALIGCIMMWTGYQIAGGMLGIMAGMWMLTVGDYFPYRIVAAESVLLGAVISIGIKSMEIGYLKEKKE